MFENLRRGRQARNFTKNVPKILDLKSWTTKIALTRLACENIRFSSLFAAVDVSRGGTKRETRNASKRPETRANNKVNKEYNKAIR